jgi:putative salt-induced outer membrane protein
MPSDRRFRSTNTHRRPERKHRDDFERTTDQFGNEGRAVGYTGSLALQASAASGNTDPASGRKDTHNTFGVSLVYNFN